MVKSAYKPILGMKQLQIFLLSLYGMLLHCKVTPNMKFTGTDLHTWVESYHESKVHCPKTHWTRITRSGVECTNHYRGPVIWNFVIRLVKVPESFYSFKQILRKYVKITDNFSFDKGATVVANKKDHFIYF